jgi:hypothetical protein
MEESELRVGGWEKEGKRRWLKRFFSLILVALLGLLVIGPTLIEYKTAEVGQNSLYLATGIWNGPFDQRFTKEFNGHFKISSLAYETTDGGSGRLVVMSINSLANLESQIEGIVVEKIKEKAEEEGLTLVGNGVVLNENNDQLPHNAVMYKWDARVTEAATFFEPLGVGEILQVKTIFWTQNNWQIQDGFQTIICVAFGVSQTTINQATELVENVS